VASSSWRLTRGRRGKKGERRQAVFEGYGKREKGEKTEGRVAGVPALRGPQEKGRDRSLNLGGEKEKKVLFRGGRRGKRPHF